MPVMQSSPARYVWPAGAIWTVLIIAAMLVLHNGSVASIELGAFAVFIGLWLAGVMALTGGFLAARGRELERGRSLAAVIEREASYRRLFQASPSAMFIHDLASLKILAANAAAQRHYGYSPEEFLQLTLRDLHPAGEAAAPSESVPPDSDRALAQTVVHRRKDGTAIHVEVSAQTVEWEDRAARCLLVIDVTQRERAIAALRESEAALNAAQRVAQVGSWTWTIPSNELQWSDEMLRIFGLRREDFTGKLQDVIASAIHPDDRAKVEAANRAVLEKGSPEPVEYRVVTPDGTVRVVWAEGGELQRDHHGQPVQLSGIVQDITERKHAEERMRTANARLQTLIGSLRMGVLVEDSERRAAVANAELCRLFGLAAAPSQLEGISCADAARRVAAQFVDPERFVARVAELIAQRQPCVSETLALADGRVFERDYIPIADEGAGQGHLWVYRDVTARQRMEDALEKRLVALTGPIDVAGSIRFEDLFNLGDIQRLQDLFASATGVASIITRPDGTPITQSSNFTRLCGGIVRQTETGLCNCLRSDALLGRRNPDGPNVQQCLSAGLWDAGASIVVGGRHIANWLIGQVRNDTQSEENVRAYARTIGVDEVAYMEAYRQVPCMSRERFEVVAQTLFTLSQQLSSMAYQNVQQARFITERDRAEKALRASEEHFREAIEHAGAGYFRIDRQGCFETVNSAWLQMHGFTDPAQIVGRPFSTTQVERDLPAAEQVVREGFAGHEMHAGEFTRKRVDGSVGYHSYSLHPVRRGDEVIALEGFLIDTTSLHRARADYRMLFDAMLDGFALHEIVCDAEGRPVDYRFLAVNPAFERHTGINAAELVGRTVLEAMPQTEARWIEVYGRVALTGEPATFESYSQALNRYFEVSAFRPSPQQFACVFVDITARRLAELELRKLSRAVEQSPVSVIITDASGAIEYINPYFTATTGYALEEVRGRNPRLLSSGETPPDRYRLLWQTISSGREWRGEFHNRRKDGTLFWEAATIGPIIGDDGRIAHYLAVKEDITERKRAEAALASSERRFRSLVENVPNIAVQGYDRARRVIFWNAASEALYGYTSAEALGQKLEDLIIPPEMREGVIAAVDGLVNRDEPIPAGELMLRRKDGSSVSVYSSHVKLDRADGEPEMHCIDIDLTARKVAERALAEAHEFHLRILTQAPALIWRSGANGKCNWFNETWLTFTGRTLEQESGDGWLQGIHADDVQRRTAAYLEAFEARRPFEIEYRLRRQDGTYRWISDNGIPFHSVAGEFGGFIGYCFDITEHQLAEARIREQAALLDVTEDAILVTDLDRTVSYWNRGAERMYEIPASDARARKLEDLVYRELPANYHGEWTRVLDHGEWTGDRRQVTRSGREIEVRIRAKLVRNASGEPTSVLVVTTDITESRRMESQFLRAQRLESLGALASGVAHDLNNVLTPILMSVELLRPLAHEQHDHDMLQLLSDSARRGSDIVQQLLLFGRGSDSPRSPLNAGGIIKDVGRMMRETFPKNIVLSIHAPADLWLVEADRTQLHQVVLNLCVNARDAMPLGGRLTVAAENVQVTADFAERHGSKRSGPHVCIRVKDTGSGIAPEHLDKIFDPFFTTKPVGQGTGLGLATVVGIVRGHDGLVEVSSEPGRGATFEVFLPAAHLPAEVPDGPTDRADVRGNGELVLVIEDEEGIRSMLQRALSGRNFRVLVASDGAEALGIYAQNAAAVQLVISDMMMPVMDGAQTVRALRRLNPGLPVVAISGLPAQRAELEKCPGPRIRFLPKPFTSDDALALVGEALAGNGAAPD